MYPHLSRRDAILAAAAAALAVGAPLPSSAQEAVSLDAFLALSRDLTRAADLDPAVGETLLGAFLASGQGAALRALALGEGAGPLADAVVAAWYSGLYDADGVQRVADFDGALVWTALDFTKPFATCGGEAGYWSAAPDA